MENMPPEISQLGTPTDAKMETALIRREDHSMWNGGGGRFQLLTGAGGTFGESMAPAGAAATAPANAET
jgi:hypothetical protein